MNIRKLEARSADQIRLIGRARELLTLGCSTGQGVLYAKPGPPEAVLTGAGRSLDPAHAGQKPSEAGRSLDAAHADRKPSEAGRSLDRAHPGQ